MDTAEKILKEFQRLKKVSTAQLVKNLQLTRQAINYQLQKLVHEGKILKQGTSPKSTFYILNSPRAIQALWGESRVFKKRYTREKLQEDQVFQELLRQPMLLTKLSQNALNIFQYAFTEMLNNAIDHSQSKLIDLVVTNNAQLSSFSIRDTGIGIFFNIQKKNKLQTELEAIQDLLKGKQTTQPERHSGEGIFFTSKMVALFVLESHRKRLTINNRINDIFIEDIRVCKGTRVYVEIENNNSLKMEKVFQKYTNADYQFDKTKTTIKLFQEGETLISRSQAKRLLFGLEKFHEVVLDFQGIKTVGQGFADEVFRVFVRQHPGLSLIPVNCHENVQFMIDRAKRHG